MDAISNILPTLVEQLQKPTLAFLLGGMLLAALGSKLEVPKPVYQFIVIVLLLKVGIGAGISLREAELSDIILPALAAAGLGVGIVLLGALTLAKMRGVSPMDAMAAAGLFGAVSASTLAVGMAMLEEEGIAYEGYVGALYPFMDVAALLTAILLARMAAERQSANLPSAGGTVTMGGGSGGELGMGEVKSILVDTLRSPAISALLLGLGIGIYAAPVSLYESFYDQLFRGFLSLLMLTMGMEAWSRLSELRKVAHVYVLYAVTAPLIHGLMGFGAGMVLNELMGFSAGGVVLLAVLAASSSDISGPPTLRAALPEANPSAYVAPSTGLGTPVAILLIPLWIAMVEALI
ncbi:MAG: sodium-dependent bicarbonate transport family permease [Pseudomonadota bacterium]